MKVAIVRGPSLCKWEMQTYEPLESKLELLGIGSKLSDYDLSLIEFPIVRLACAGEYLAFIPGGIQALCRYYGDPQMLIGYDRVIAGIDIVHAVELRSYFSLQTVRAKRKGLIKAVTLTVYENIPFIGDDNLVRRRLKQEVLEGTDHFLAVSEGAKKTLLLEGVPDKNISVVGQGVDIARFKPRKLKSQNSNFKTTRNKYGLAKSDFVVLSVGRIVWEKGWYDLVRAAYTVGKSKGQGVKSIKFLFVGEGSERENLEAMVKRLGLEKMVVFTGRVSYDQMPGIFKIADIFVHASLPTRDWNEQFGGVLIEAMATGLPIIATLNGGIEQTVEDSLFGFTVGDFIGKGGIYLPPQDYSEIAKAIIKLIENRKIRRDMGIRNRKRAVKLFDNRVVSEKIMRIWEEVLVNSK